MKLAMRSIDQEQELWLAQIDRPFRIELPFEGNEFSLLLLVADPSITAQEQASIAHDIVRLKCRYAVCTGLDCSSWDDAIDYAFLLTDPNFSPPDDTFVMTSWHEKDSLEDVSSYFRWCTHFDNFVPRYFLALILGGGNDRIIEVERALRKAFASTP